MYSFLKSSTAGSLYSAGCEGRLPTVLKTSICCSGATIHFTKAAAAATFLPWDGMVHQEPAQLPPPPGVAAMSHLPFWSGAVSWMWLIIHAGQLRTANWSFLKPWSLFGWKLARLAE